MSPNLLRIRRPTDGSRVGEMPVTSRDGVRAAVQRARSAQPGWASLTAEDRARRMGGLLAEIERRSDEIADRIVSETGKPEVEALMEVAMVQRLLRHYRSRAPRILRPRRIGSGFLLWKRAWTVREPYGVVGIISPWNFPFLLPMEPLITALLAGNGVVLKPSPVTPFTGALASELILGGGLPEGLVQVVQGEGETGRHLVQGGIHKLHFTGGALAGRQVLAAAAELLLPVTLELGGKDPAVVLEDADLDRAARGIVFGAFFNAGQTCVSTERVFVMEEVYEPFLRRVRELARELRVGGGGRIDLGPITTQAQLAIIEEQLLEAVQDGARILCGGERADPVSNLFLPTVLADVRPEMRIMREETFGPILPVMSVRNEEEALQEIRALPGGLWASVWTRSPERGRALAERIPGGGVSINDTLSHWSIPGLPMGGVGESGFGRSRGEEGLRDLTRAKGFLEDRSRFRRDSWWYPYSGGTVRLMRALIAWESASGAGRLLRAIRGFLRRGEA